MLTLSIGAEHHLLQTGSEKNTNSELEEMDMYYDQKDCGARIRDLRKANNLTQEQLAMKLNISDNYICKLEKGVYGGSFDLMIDLAELFNVSLDYLILGRQPNETLHISVIKKTLISVIEILTKLVNQL